MQKAGGGTSGTCRRMGSDGAGGLVRRAEAGQVSRGESTVSVPVRESAQNLNSCFIGKSSCNSDLETLVVRVFVALQSSVITAG